MLNYIFHTICQRTLKINYKKQEQLISLDLDTDASVEQPLLKQQILDSSFCLLFRELKSMLNTSSLSLFLPFSDNSNYEFCLMHPIQQASTYRIQITLKEGNSIINSTNLKHIELLLPKYLQMLDNNGTPSNFTSAVRQMILHLCTPELPNLPTLARQFAMSSRSLQRRLQKEDSSFRAISLDIKKELSTYLHAGNKMAVKEIAYILGYAETSAYLHAKKTWLK